MHSRRFSMLLVGLWLGAGLFMTWVATDNYDSVDRALKPATKVGEQAVNDIGQERAREFLRYHSSEQNRHYSIQWGLAQMVLGVFLLVVVLFATNANALMTALAGGLLAISCLQYFLVTPRIIDLGRALDFANVDEMRDERRGFWNYQRAYSYMDLAKWGILLVVAGRLVVSSGERRKRRRRSNEFDAINEAENGHAGEGDRAADSGHRRKTVRRRKHKVAGAEQD